jgi:hypothetical protein
VASITHCSCFGSRLYLCGRGPGHDIITGGTITHPTVNPQRYPPVMADYQCPACYEVLGSSPKYAPMALKCGKQSNFILIIEDLRRSLAHF